MMTMVAKADLNAATAATAMAASAATAATGHPVENGHAAYTFLQL